tara:strand:- start:97 stop:327 length:231 start_codon:yes stop_codon:yes gene_type:complete
MARITIKHDYDRKLILRDGVVVGKFSFSRISNKNGTFTKGWLAWLDSPELDDVSLGSYSWYSDVVRDIKELAINHK